MVVQPDVLARGPLLSVREVAERLNLTTATVYKLCSTGKLRHARILNSIRVHPADLEELIRAQARPSSRSDVCR